jgi:hypothetical protein
VRDFRVSDLDSGDSSAGRLKFIAVPEQLRVRTGGSAATALTGGFLNNRFRVEVDGISLTGVAGVNDLRVVVPKLPLAGGGRQLFEPGTPGFDRVEVEVANSSAGNATAAILDDWANDVGTGQVDQRLIHIQWMNAALSDVLMEAALGDASPVSALEPFVGPANRRSIEFGFQHLDLDL